MEGAMKRAKAIIGLILVVSLLFFPFISVAGRLYVEGNCLLI